MDVRYFFVRDAQQDGLIDIQYVETENQLADCVMKALAVPRFEKLRSNLNIQDIKEE